jgi:hypothetical protein
MKHKTIALALLVVMLASTITFAADDGPLSMRNLSRTPDTMTGASQMSTMWLYVPAQDTQGEPPDTTSGELEYYAGDCTNQDPSACTLIYTRSEAKPLIATYNDGIEEEIGSGLIGTGAGFGERDAFAALSLDDGATWKDWDLSDSAARSSFMLRNGHEYPGDVFKLVHQVEGNMVVAAWISRYCESGAPLYSWLDEEKTGLLTAYPELDHPVTVDGGTDPDGYYQLYMDDMFTVGGTQVSVDYTEQGFPEVGEIPYGCVWVARGSLEQDLDESGNPLFNSVGDPVYDITWRASERLTSGRRDPHQISITSSPGAGFVIFWQEDPEGLRPGKGLGPGEGWSGAIANSKTDVWYAYLDLAHFGDVCTDDPVEGTYCIPGTLAEFNTSLLFGQKPKAAVPFAMPVRITDNNACKGVQKFDTNGELIDAYCYADFNANGDADLCASTVSWTNPGGTTLEVCVTEDGRTLTGRTASTRVRAAMKSYDSDGDGAPDSAWVLFGSEKMKAMGTVGDNCDPTTDPECTVFDIGKNMHYYTYEFDKPALVTQGLMLNAPALSPETGEPFEIYVDEWGNDIYDTEIARRFNLFVNSAPVADASTSRTMGLLIYKQGILFQGGPADIFIRRLVLPDTFDPAVDNPFAYENVECVSYDDGGVATPVDRLYPDGINPNYVLGLCPVDGMNVSGTTIVRCDDGSAGEACADLFPFNSTYEEWFSDDSQIQIPKVLEWSQTVDNLNDASWENPYDVSKGHRGFIDGDFVMMMYATAENWKAGTVGNEAYQLYIRRSFDGGQTWTTLPADYTHWAPLPADLTIVADGTTTCEWYGGYGEDDYSVCTDYAAGEFEPARNVSQLAGTRVTVLDPRYTPSGGMLKKDYTSLLCDPELDGIWTNCSLSEATYPEDVRDPSAFFATFETGDNSAVTVETATTPLDMYYSRASNFGDDWDEQNICDGDLEEPWYPSAGLVCDSTDDVELRWDWLENGEDWATEASVDSNPAGDRFYAVWNQELLVGYDDAGEEIFADQDTQFRRIFYNLYADTIPTGYIAYVSDYTLSIANGDVLLLAGVGRDYDRQGEWPDIIDHMWFDDEGTVYCDIEGYDDQGNPIYDCAKQIEVRADELSLGKHTFHYRVQDNEGTWSSPDAVEVWVAYQWYPTYFPLIAK